MNKLACFYWTKKGGAEKNKDEAVRLWKMAADLCYEPAVYNIFKEKSLSEYKDKFEAICNSNFAPALNYRGWLKLNEFNGYSKSKSIYDDIEKSAKLGNVNAMKNYETYKKKGKVGFFSYSFESDPIY